MAIILLGGILFVIGLVLFLSLFITEDSGTVFWSAWSMLFIIIGFSLIAIKSNPTVSQICEENAICYELVQTVAENTDYSEYEVAEFFAIISDDIEAWHAIKLLDNTLTDEQIDAIMEISAMRQEQAK